MIIVKREGKKLLKKETKEIDAKKVLSKIALEILNCIKDKPLYAKKIAKMLKKDSQEIYYYIRKLKELGLIEEVGKKEILGGIAKFYKASATSFFFQIDNNGWEEIKEVNVNEKVFSFFNPLIEKGFFNGYIVVGSPIEHGKYFAKARDGHYAIQLSFLLGKYCETKHFIVKLDTDIIAEKLLGENLILIGGPGTNVVTEKFNKYFPIKFNEEHYWKGFKVGKNDVFGENLAVIERIRNPLNKKKFIWLFAGLKNHGTKGAIIAISKFYNRVLKDFNNQEKFALLIKVLDLDGDGKVDNFKIIEKIA